jgi:hypothetical protein
MTLSVCAVVMLLEAGVTVTVGVTGGGGGGVPPGLLQPLKTQTTLIALMKANMLGFIL